LTTRVAIYARHSTDKQTHSTKDQIARCEAYCQNAGYVISLVFQDEAISGSSVVNRPGVSELIDAALCGYFDRVITEDLSRISRDQADMANFFRKMRYLDIGLESVSEGVINELHIGFKGTMNALYIVDLADKTRRGMIASVLKGSIPGGRTYGYDLVHRLDERQELIKGLRQINPKQASVVRQIYDQYAAGATLNYICEGLNRQGIPAPKGGLWVNTTLIGHAARKTGLLRQSLYKGVVTFNRMMYRKNPETGKRQSFIRPESDWIQVPVPELAIIAEDQFDTVQTQIEERSSLHKQRILLNQVLAAPDKPANVQKRKRQAEKRKTKTRKVSLYIFSGKLWCEDHNTPISVIRKKVYSCNSKPCQHRNIQHEVFMSAALDALRHMSVDQIKSAIDELRTVRNKLETKITKLDTRLEEARRNIRGILDGLKSRKMTPETNAYLDEHEAEVLKIKYEIDTLKKQYDPMSKIPDEEADDVLQSFNEAIAPLHDDPDNQLASSQTYLWFDRFVVKSEGKETVISIDYNWPKMLVALRAVKSAPFLSRPAVILPRQTSIQEDRA